MIFILVIILLIISIIGVVICERKKSPTLSPTLWNTDLAFKKEAQRDFWVGIFYPNIYDEIDFIEME